MTYDLSLELETRYSSWSDVDLVEALTLQRDDYTEQAIQAMQKVLGDRGVSLEGLAHSRCEANVTPVSRHERTYSFRLTPAATVLGVLLTLVTLLTTAANLQHYGFTSATSLVYYILGTAAFTLLYSLLATWRGRIGTAAKLYTLAAALCLCAGAAVLVGSGFRDDYLPVPAIIATLSLICAVALGRTLLVLPQSPRSYIGWVVGAFSGGLLLGLLKYGLTGSRFLAGDILHGLAFSLICVLGSDRSGRPVWARFNLLVASFFVAIVTYRIATGHYLLGIEPTLLPLSGSGPMSLSEGLSTIISIYVALGVIYGVSELASLVRVVRGEVQQL